MGTPMRATHLTESWIMGIASVLLWSHRSVAKFMNQKRKKHFADSSPCSPFFFGQPPHIEVYPSDLYRCWLTEPLNVF